MKKFATTPASLTNNNTKNCNSSSCNSSKITNKLIANQITNDIIRPKAISAAEAKLKNANNCSNNQNNHNHNYNHGKNYAKLSNDLSKCNGKGGSGGGASVVTNGGKGGSYRERIDAPTIETNEYSLHLGESSAAIEILSCTSTNSSESSFSNSRVCVEYATANDLVGFARKNSCSNEYQTSNYLMHHRPKSSQSQHNPYKSPGGGGAGAGDKAKSRKHYSPQHTTNSMKVPKKTPQKAHSKNIAPKPSSPPSPPPPRSRYTEHSYRSERHN